MGLLVQLTAAIFILVLVSTHHPTAGGGHDPLLVLDGYKDDGIQLKCFSERLFSEVQVLWTDGRGANVTGTPLTTGTPTANANSSIILKPGSGNSVSCKIVDKLLKTSTESSVVIADVFFPATSPWLAAFVVILLLSIFLVIAAIYKLRKNNKTTIREQKVQNELEFRRAHSKAVNITLDENCKHPSLTIKEKNRVMSSTQEKISPKAVVVATEGFSEKKHYWEVEVGDKSEWELGVMCQFTVHSPNNVVIQAVGEEAILPCYISAPSIPVRKGNLSLKLRNIQVADKGKYTCKVAYSNWYRETYVELDVTGQYLVLKNITYTDKGEYICSLDSEG
ncbi:butyrophilin-like protein 9 [Phoenicopterus ruber ruber]